MPWKELPVDGMRMEFVIRAREAVSNVSELCREYGISRKTGYKWLSRYESCGVGGLADLSRTPRSNSLSIDGGTAADVVCRSCGFSRCG